MWSPRLRLASCLTLAISVNAFPWPPPSANVVPNHIDHPGRPGPPQPAHPPGPPFPPGMPGLFDNATVFTPPSTWTDQSTSYERTVLLNQNCEKDNVLLSTWTQSDPSSGPYWPIAKSTDEGRTWSEISRVYFTNQNYTGGIFLQPSLYELPQRMGKYPAGTVLLSGNGIPRDFSSTNIELYASLDKGYNWQYVSTVAVGTGPNTTNGANPVWEPFIMLHDNVLGVFYSDQRDPLHGQKLAHQESTDLVSWGPVINDVAYANYTLRPGMTSVAKLGNGQFMISFELAFAQEDPILAPYAVHYKIASSPFEFANAEPMLLKASDGTMPSACPYTVWTPVGPSPKGTVVLSDGTYSELFINTNYGNPKDWVKVPSGKGIAYSRQLRVMPDEKVILVVNGGIYAGTNTSVTVGDWVVPGAPSNFNSISSCGGDGWALH